VAAGGGEVVVVVVVVVVVGGHVGVTLVVSVRIDPGTFIVVYNSKSVAWRFSPHYQQNHCWGKILDLHYGRDLPV
jgi:hypothetical protein